MTMCYAHVHDTSMLIMLVVVLINVVTKEEDKHSCMYMFVHACVRDRVFIIVSKASKIV